MPTLLLTGASRGIGFEFARQYSAEGWRVLATCRRPEAPGQLGALATRSAGTVSVHRLDVASPEQIAALAGGLADLELDLLINNAGVYPESHPLGGIDFEAWEEAFRVNTIAPVRMAEAFLPALLRAPSPVIVNITSKMGSIADNTSGGCYGYRASKAALNALNKSLAIDLAGEGFTCVVLHPGWVRTEMGGAAAPLEARESVAGMLRVIDELDPSRSGQFIDFEGEQVPW